MSLTRVMCNNCKFPLAYCSCSKPESLMDVIGRLSAELAAATAKLWQKTEECKISDKLLHDAGKANERLRALLRGITSRASVKVAGGYGGQMCGVEVLIVALRMTGEEWSAIDAAGRGEEKSK